jgi:hypothetical protein
LREVRGSLRFCARYWFTCIGGAIILGRRTLRGCKDICGGCGDRLRGFLRVKKGEGRGEECFLLRGRLKTWLKEPREGTLGIRRPQGAGYREAMKLSIKNESTASVEIRLDKALLGRLNPRVDVV